MKAEELRIGNYVFLDNHISRVVAVNKFGVAAEIIIRANQSTNSGQHSPIPLTEEWLGKFGYEFDDFCNIWFIDDGIQIDIFKTNSGDFSMDIPHTPDIKHVHQLQNLYFALTGEELTIKESENEKENN